MAASSTLVTHYHVMANTLQIGQENIITNKNVDENIDLRLRQLEDDNDYLNDTVSSLRDENHSLQDQIDSLNIAMDAMAIRTAFQIGVITLLVEEWNCESERQQVEVDSKMTLLELENIVKTVVGVNTSICCINKAVGDPLYRYDVNMKTRIGRCNISDGDIIFYRRTRNN